MTDPTQSIKYTAIVDGKEIEGVIFTGGIELYGHILTLTIRADIKHEHPKAKSIRITSH